jgi:hypothetical protein
VVGIHVGTVVPDMGNEDGTIWSGEIDAYGPRRVIGGVDPDGDGIVGGLA